MYEHILIAADNSETSIQALFEAIKLAKKLNARLSIVHIINTLLPTLGGLCLDNHNYEETLRIDGQTMLSNMENVARSEGLSVGTELIELHHINVSIAEKILEISKLHNPDLLVLGTHAKGINRILLGSIAEAVLRDSTIPTLIIPGKE